MSNEPYEIFMTAFDEILSSLSRSVSDLHDHVPPEEMDKLKARIGYAENLKENLNPERTSLYSAALRMLNASEACLPSQNWNGYDQIEEYQEAKHNLRKVLFVNPPE